VLTVVYDACVLYPAPLRDLLMHLALSDLYQARWSELIHDEWTRNVLASRPDLKPEQLARTRQLMNAHVRGCLVSGFEHLIGSIALPDADDRHVVAAAVHCQARLIVTFNLKDFPAKALTPYNLVARHPDDFIVDLLELHSGEVVQAVAAHQRSLQNPPKTVEEYLDTLAAQGLTQSAAALRQWTAAL
jgi:DNA-binding IclR family transcriptional regulator